VSWSARRRRDAAEFKVLRVVDDPRWN